MTNKRMKIQIHLKLKTDFWFCLIHIFQTTKLKGSVYHICEM